jgi:hypothetical protein
MQINKLLYIIRSLSTTYENTIFINKNLWINKKAYLFAQVIFHMLKNQLIQTRTYTNPKSLIKFIHSGFKCNKS